MPDKKPTPAKNVVVVGQEQLRRIAEYVLRESAAGEVRSILNIGTYLFGQLFRGSEEAFRSRDPNKRDSLNDLAAQKGMAEASWSRTRLRNAIELALMARVHNGFRAWRFLRVSHYEEVLGLPAEKQRELLDRAEQEGWSVLRLKQEACKQKPQRPAPAKVASTPDKALGRVRKAMGQVAALAAPAGDLAEVLVEAGIDADAAAEFTATVEKAAGMLKGFEGELEELKKRSAAKLKRVAGKVAAPG